LAVVRTAREVPIVGAAAFVLLSDCCGRASPSFYMIILGIFLVLFILFLPRDFPACLIGRVRHDDHSQGRRHFESFDGLKALSNVPSMSRRDRSSD